MADARLSFDGSAVQTKTVSGSEVRMQLKREEIPDMKVDATLNSQTAEITVYEDTDGDGTPENVETKTVSDGINSYSLNNLGLLESSEYWVEISLQNGDVTKTAKINYVEINTA